MEKKRNILTLLLAFCMMASLAGPAFALEYAFDGAEGLAYGKSTSIEVVHTPGGGAMKNEDVSKNAALAPPTFGSASADTLHTGTPLTPNLAPGYQPTSGGIINGGVGVIQPPTMGGSMGTDSSSGSVYVPGSSSVTVTNPSSASGGYTAVTDDLYYSNGSLGTLKIPAIGLSVKVYQGTDSTSLKRRNLMRIYSSSTNCMKTNIQTCTQSCISLFASQRLCDTLS